MNNRNVSYTKKFHRNNRLKKSDSRNVLYSTGLYIRYKQLSRMDVLEFMTRNNLYYPENVSEGKAQEDARTIIHYIDDFKTRTYTRKGKKTGKTYMTIYAHRLLIMVPKDCDKPVSEYLYAFMDDFLCASPNLLWMAQTYKLGSIQFIDVMVFTRRVLAEPICQSEVHSSDYYWNTKTLRRASHKEAESCTDGTIILRHKKGEKKRDENGNVITHKATCASKEVPLFKYARRNDHTNISGFEVMMEQIKGVFAGAVSKISLGVRQVCRLIRKVTYKPGKYRQSTLLKIGMRNRIIARINALLAYIYRNLSESSMLEDPEIRSLWYRLLGRLTHICHDSEIRYAGITMSITYKGWLCTFKERMLFMESAAEEAIKKFYGKIDRILFEWELIPSIPKSYDVRF